jgi:hypothetical protein
MLARIWLRRARKRDYPVPLARIYNPCPLFKGTDCKSAPALIIIFVAGNIFSYFYLKYILYAC